jgi:hypothetical protein
MLNRVPATRRHTGHHDPQGATGTADASTRFAPLCTRPVKLAMTTVADELGRPLVSVFVPDGELLQARRADQLAL